ncbi:hypothetical protein [Bacteroides ndongoniae]|uniref:hypothetical protein n=1 Tax=Bacteroides ndongoniae TaxID=1903262 RepID=UPI0023F78C66|nr:hypothetical protein [Bacteroides ndongoniae]
MTTGLNRKQTNWGKAIVSIAVTLAAMPLTHILARMLKDGTTGVEQFYAGMGMGAFGLGLVIAGVFIKGDVRQSLLGLFGGMFYWMGAIDFLFMYYAERFGTQAQLDPVTGEIVSRPEYLILPATFGFWMMVMMLYLFCTANGCNFLNWWQRLFFGKHKKEIAARPMTRHTSIVAFMEVITMLWTCYLTLMFCYDERFLGDRHPVTLLVGMLGLISSLFMFARLLRYSSWGMSLRYGFATVIIFWIAVEVFDRISLLPALWNAPGEHILQIILIGGSFAVAGLYVTYRKMMRRV